ncbi:MAG: hypothetical protein LIO62_06210 [Clostridiales bacterium]|nr:hypothetical protein [Clostridiales bacterium]
MKKIAYIVPYFGKFPNNGFKLWLTSCAANPTVNWIIFTDDKTEYNYPENVEVHYCTFDDMRNRIQKNYDFPIVLDRGWKLCDYKPAYGEIFAEELKGYDFWGNCDIDLMWGNIRKYYNDDVLEKYERVGFFGHSNLYLNTPEVNSRYRTVINGIIDYKTAFSSSTGYGFDEVGMDNIYKALRIPYYNKVIFANLTKYERKFHLGSMPKKYEYKNRRQIFTWENGKVLRHYLDNGKIFTEEYLYIHFWCRPMSYRVKNFSQNTKYLIYSDVLTDKPFTITSSLINRKGISHPVRFYAKSIWKNRHKITLERIIFNIKGSLGLND